MSSKIPANKQYRIPLFSPHLSGSELLFVREAFESNWLSSVGPHISQLEAEFQAKFGLHAAALSTGAAAIHLGLRLLGVGAGDEVVCPTLTSFGTANPICYLGAKPIFVDSEPITGDIDVSLVAALLRERAAKNRLPKVIIVTHLHGCPADTNTLAQCSLEYGIPLLEDVTQAIGARYSDKYVGTCGEVAAFSFDISSVVTCFGGGILAARRSEWVEKARFWATQARDAAPWYEHSEAGYNYRLSNVLAGIARPQLQMLDERIAQRQAIALRYWEAFANLEGILPMAGKNDGDTTCAASAFQIDESKLGLERDDLVAALAVAGIESRPILKPLHLCSLYNRCEVRGGEVAERLFRRGICLPSSSHLSVKDQMYIINSLIAATNSSRRNGVETFA
jgi:pyridoxal phosphate-dependent aminotransferase EpsN